MQRGSSGRSSVASSMFLGDEAAALPVGERLNGPRDVFAGRNRVSSMCAGQESKREVRDRRSVGWDWRVAAVPGAEWRVPLWNTAGFEPRLVGRLRLDARCTLLSSSPLLFSTSVPLCLAQLIPSHFSPLAWLFPQEHWVQHCRSLPIPASSSPARVPSSLPLSSFLLYSSLFLVLREPLPPRQRERTTILARLFLLTAKPESAWLPLPRRNRAEGSALLKRGCKNETKKKSEPNRVSLRGHTDSENVCFSFLCPSLWYPSWV